MTMKIIRNSLNILIITLALSACQQATPALAPDLTLLDEQPVTQIDLAGPVSKTNAEVSGMAWCGDHLILLPQFPDQFKEDGVGQVFSLPKDLISIYLESESPTPLEPEKVVFDTDGLPQLLSGFEGFEAIAFDGDQVFVTIETRQSSGMMGYLVKGQVNSDCSQIALDSQTMIELPPQAGLSNMSDETILIYEDNLYTIYEANGANVNPDPVAQEFDINLSPEGDVALPNIEYRLTDATVVNADGTFWAINYFFPGDIKLKPAEDQIALEFGIGLTHQTAEQVERLIELQILDGDIRLVDVSPIYLTLTSDEANNWEGLVRFEEGFLLVTDEYPTTILGYVDGIKE